MLQPPFDWLPEQLLVLEQCLAHSRIIESQYQSHSTGLVPFTPHINVLKTQELLTLQTDLMAHLETLLGIVDPVSKTRPSPHMTVAFRDLTRQNFKAAWPEFQQRQLHLVHLAT